MWENKYKHIQDIIDTALKAKTLQSIENAINIQQALIRKLYSVHGFDIKEIMKYTRKGKVYILDCIEDGLSTGSIFTNCSHGI
jgi:hypothetical protein